MSTVPYVADSLPNQDHRSPITDHRSQNHRSQITVHTQDCQGNVRNLKAAGSNLKGFARIGAWTSTHFLC